MKKSPPGQTITGGDYHKAFDKAVYCTIIIPEYMLPYPGNHLPPFRNPCGRESR